MARCGRKLRSAGGTGENTQRVWRGRERRFTGGFMERNYEILCLAFLSAQPVAAYSEGPSILHSMSIAHTHYPIIPSVLAVDFPAVWFLDSGFSYSFLRKSKS
jgi:hypothetical protein